MENIEIEDLYNEDGINHFQAGGTLYTDIDAYNKMAQQSNPNAIIVTNKDTGATTPVGESFSTLAEPYKQNSLMQMYLHDQWRENFNTAPAIPVFEGIKSSGLIAMEKATGMSKSDYFVAMIKGGGKAPAIPLNLPIQPYTIKSLEEYESKAEFKQMFTENGVYNKQKAQQFYKQGQNQLKAAYEQQHIAAMYPDSKYLGGAMTTAFNPYSYRNEPSQGNKSKYDPNMNLIRNMYKFDGFTSGDGKIKYIPDAEKRATTKGEEVTVGGKKVVYYDPESMGDYQKYQLYGAGIIKDKDKKGNLMLRLRNPKEDMSQAIGNVFRIDREKVVDDSWGGFGNLLLGLGDSAIYGATMLAGATVNVVRDFYKWSKPNMAYYGLDDIGFNTAEGTAKDRLYKAIAATTDAKKKAELWSKVDNRLEGGLTALAEGIDKFSWRPTSTNQHISSGALNFVSHYGEGVIQMAGQVAGLALTKNPAALKGFGAFGRVAALGVNNSTPIHLAKNATMYAAQKSGAAMAMHNLVSKAKYIDDIYTYAVKTNQANAGTIAMVKFASMNAEEVNKKFLEHNMDLSSSMYVPMVYGLSYLLNKADDYIIGGNTTSNFVKYLMNKTGLVNMSSVFQATLKEELKGVSKSLIELSNVDKVLQDQLMKSVTVKAVNKTLANLHNYTATKGAVSALTEIGEELLPTAVAHHMEYFRNKEDKQQKAVPKSLLEVKGAELRDVGIFTYFGHLLTSRLGLSGGKAKINNFTNNNMMSIISDDTYYKSLVSTLEKEASGKGIGLLYAKGLKLEKKGTETDIVVAEEGEESFNQQLAKSLLVQVKSMRNLYLADVDVRMKELKEAALKNFKKEGVYKVKSKEGEFYDIPTTEQVKEEIGESLASGTLDTYIKHIADKDFFDKLMKIDDWNIDELTLQEKLKMLSEGKNYEGTINHKPNGAKTGAVEKKEVQSQLDKLQKDYLDYYFYATAKGTPKSLDEYITFKTNLKGLQEAHFNKAKERFELLQAKDKEIAEPNNKAGRVQYTEDFINGKVSYYTEEGKKIVEEKINELQEELDDTDVKAAQDAEVSAEQSIKGLRDALQSGIPPDSNDTANFDMYNIIKQGKEETDDEGVPVGITEDYTQDEIDDILKSVKAALVGHFTEDTTKAKESLTKQIDNIKSKLTNVDNKEANKPIFLNDDAALENMINDVNGELFFDNMLKRLTFYTENEEEFDKIGIAEYAQLVTELAPLLVEKIDMFVTLKAVSKKYNAHRKLLRKSDADLAPSDLHIELVDDEGELNTVGKNLREYYKKIKAALAAIKEQAIINDSAYQKGNLKITINILNERLNYFRDIDKNDASLQDKISDFESSLALHNTSIDAVSVDANGNIDDDMLKILRDAEVALFTQLQDIQEAIFMSNTITIVTIIDDSKPTEIGKIAYLSNIKNTSSKEAIKELRSKVDTKAGIMPSIEQILAIEQLYLFSKNDNYTKDIQTFKEQHKNSVEFSQEVRSNSPAYSTYNAVTTTYADLIQSSVVKVNGANGTGKSKLFKWFSALDSLIGQVVFTAPYVEQVKNLKGIIEKGDVIEGDDKKGNIATLIEKMIDGELDGKIIVIDEHTLIPEKYTINNSDSDYQQDGYKRLLEVAEERGIKVILIGDEFQSITSESVKKDNDGRYLHEIPVLAELNQQQRGSIITLRKATDYIRALIGNLTEETVRKQNLSSSDLYDEIGANPLYVTSDEESGIEVHSNKDNFDTAIKGLDKATTLFLTDEDSAKDKNFQTIEQIQGREADTIVLKLTAKNMQEIRSNIVGSNSAVSDTDVMSRYLRNVLSLIGRGKVKVIIHVAEGNPLKFINTGTPVIKFSTDAATKKSNLEHAENTLKAAGNPTEKQVTRQEYIDRNLRLIEKITLADKTTVEQGLIAFVDAFIADTKNNAEESNLGNIEAYIKKSTFNGINNYKVVINDKVETITSNEVFVIGGDTFISTNNGYVLLTVPTGNNAKVVLFNGTNMTALRPDGSSFVLSEESTIITKKGDKAIEAAIVTLNNANATTKEIKAASKVINDGCIL